LDQTEPRNDLKGAIMKASPEFRQKVVDWCARWMARLEREAAEQHAEQEGA
jgi:hypothetical protein